MLLLAFPQLGFGALLLNQWPPVVIGRRGNRHSTKSATLWLAFLRCWISGLSTFLKFNAKGATILEFRLAGVRCRFRAFPFGGRVQSFPRHLAGYRIKKSVSILGGPLANALILLIACKFLWLDSYFNGGLFAGLEPVGMIQIANVVLLAYSLWPYEFISHRGKSPNDMLLLWRIWRLSRQEILEGGYYLFILEADECRKPKENSRKPRNGLTKDFANIPGTTACACFPHPYP